MIFRKAVATALTCLLLCCPILLSQTAAKAAADDSTIKSAGCTTAGVEAGCMVLTGFKDQKLYSLHFPSDGKPGLTLAISFEGQAGIDTCNQGIPVNVTKWTPLKMKCPKAGAAPAATERSSKSMNKEENGPCSDWKAWHDREPGHPATLHVTGKCTFNTGGYKVELRPAVPQGINPQIYILNRIVHKPTGPVTQVITEVPVHYTEKTSAKYTDVEIHPDGVKVPVKEVQ